MLYDKKWDAPKVEVTKPEKISLEGVIQWLETKDPNTEYNWLDCKGMCLLGQYLTAQGDTHWTNNYLELSQVKTNGPMGVLAEIAWTSPFTFGAALGRAKAARK